MEVFKVWRNFPHSKLICYSERGEPRLSFGYKFVGLPWKLLKIYPTVHSYFFFSSYCIVLFPLRTSASWRSAKCTRRVLKVWSHWPNSKLICYPERGTRRLSFGYKFVGLPWKLLKIYPTVHSYLFFSLHCIVLFPLRTSASWRSAKCTWRRLSAHSLRYEAIGQIQNWYVILKGEHLGFHLDINLSISLENF